MADESRQPLTARMNELAAELAGLAADDPRRAEIVAEVSRLSLLSAAHRERAENG